MSATDHSTCPNPDCPARISARLGDASTDQLVLICDRGHITTVDTDEVEGDAVQSC
jgi:hypothetical protein